jgi:outer membrane protein TolC
MIRVHDGAVLLALLAIGAPVAAQDGPETYSLERALQVALTNSHDLAAAEQSVRIASQQVREAWSNVYPDVSASASYQRNLRVQQAFLPSEFFPNAPPGELVPVQFGADNTWNAGLTANQPLFEFDVFIGVSAAGRYRSLEGERLRGSTQQVVTSVRLAYLNALLAQEEMRLTENSVRRVRQTLEETRAMNRAGLASAYDVLRLEVQLANLEPNLRRSQNAVAARKRDLLLEMGLSPDDTIELEGNLAEMEVGLPTQNADANRRLLATTGLPLEASLDLQELRELAVRRRTDLRQQRLNINLEEARLSVQKAEYFPSLSLFGNYNVQAQTNGAWFRDFYGGPNSRTSSAATGISISVPIFQGFARDARIQQTRATLDRNEAQLTRAQKQVESDVRNVLESLEETRLRVESQERAVAQARRGFEIASAEYREGVGSQLQITDAEVALRETEFNYAQAVYDYLTARVQLDATVGTVPVAAGELLARVEDRGEL